MNRTNLLRLSLCTFLLTAGCQDPPVVDEPAGGEEETLARTEFTDRLENFFEYTALRAGQASPFLIHLTDLSDGAPVEGARVVVTVRAAGSPDSVFETTALTGRVTGIYVAEVTIPRPGQYDIEFHIKNAKLDERLPLSGFEVQ